MIVSIKELYLQFFYPHYPQNYAVSNTVFVEYYYLSNTRITQIVIERYVFSNRELRQTIPYIYYINNIIIYIIYICCSKGNLNI